ncbi:MAG: hypothetical protein ACU4EQ_04910 [Candidatus Nitrosoglobus sp.]
MSKETHHKHFLDELQDLSIKELEQKLESIRKQGGDDQTLAETFNSTITGQS